MRTRTSLLFALALLVAAAAARSGSAASLGPRSSCLTNPPPNCEFDPVCTSNCAALYPKDAEARCECALGCCLPID